jgi:putative ABC transport system ATP-binding protein
MGDVDVHALRDATLTIGEGEFVAVIGPSGSGKSTLLNLIGGMDRPTTGSVHFRERDLTDSSDSELTLFRRREVGFVFQLYNLIPTLTAEENVQVAAELASKPRTVAECLKLVGLEERGDHFPSQLSGGEQQRVAIARAIVGDPPLLLCDEPTGALDSDTGQRVMELLGDLHQRLGKTVVVITHDPQVAGYAPRVATIIDGRIVSDERSTPDAATE